MSKKTPKNSIAIILSLDPSQPLKTLPPSVPRERILSLGRIIQVDK